MMETWTLESEVKKAVIEASQRYLPRKINEIWRCLLIQLFIHSMHSTIFVEQLLSEQEKLEVIEWFRSVTICY